MQTNWAEDNLHTIRTLMERSAVYRRALAPIMLFAGALGVAAAAVGLLLHLNSMRAFDTLWLGTAAIAVIGAFLIARRQAIRDSENFWSPPTRRVAQALLPPLFAGMFLGFVFVCVGLANPAILTFLWALFYGCALHSAGFFMPHGMKWFGWLFIGLTCGSLGLLAGVIAPTVEINAHWLMGFFFGVLHLAYGAYLYLTEKKNSARVNPELFLKLDRVIHEKGRLAIMSMLAATPELSFTELRDVLTMTDGNLTTHIKRVATGRLCFGRQVVSKQSPTHHLLADDGGPQSVRRIHQPA